MFNFFINLGKIGEGEGFGPFSKVTDFGSATATLETILSKIVGFLTIIGGVWFGLQLILGAFSWISAGGNKESLKNAQDKIVNAVIGLVILVAAYALISVMGMLVGLDILNPGKGLQTIK